MVSAHPKGGFAEVSFSAVTEKEVGGILKKNVTVVCVLA